METSRLGFGTASLHHTMRAAKRQALLHAALDAGFLHFDTARMYGDGMAERSLGDFLQGGLRQCVTLATKFGLAPNPTFERLPTLMYAQRALGSIGRRIGWYEPDHRTRNLSLESVDSSLAASMKALRTDWLDVVFVHEPQIADIAALQRLAEWLLQQKAKGRVRYIGLAGSAHACIAVKKAISGVFEILQVEDSAVDREADALLAAGLPLQITYGYLRQASRQTELADPYTEDSLAAMRVGLGRNAQGMVLVSTRKAHRLRQLADLAEKGVES